MLRVDLRDPMVNQFNSNMTQKVSGWDGQLGPAGDQLLASLQHLLRPGLPPPTVAASVQQQ